LRLALRLREAWQSRVVNAAEFAVEVGCLHVEVSERGHGARIFGSPVAPGPGQQLRAAVVDARGHAIAVELDLVHPLRSRRWLLDRLGKLWRDEARQGRVSPRRARFEGLRGRTLDDTRHLGNPNDA
jgi:hypothetical protein